MARARRAGAGDEFSRLGITWLGVSAASLVAASSAAAAAAAAMVMSVVVLVRRRWVGVMTLGEFGRD